MFPDPDMAAEMVMPEAETALIVLGLITTKVLVLTVSAPGTVL